MAKERTPKADAPKKDKSKDKDKDRKAKDRHSSADSRVKKSKSKKSSSSSKRATTPPTDDESESVVVEVRSGQPEPESELLEAHDRLPLQDQSGILVPFARPLAGEKLSKKALKTVKKGELHFCWIGFGMGGENCSTDWSFGGGGDFCSGEE